MSNNHLTSTRFSDLKLHPKLIKSLENEGFHFCTPIQEKSLPLALSGKDIIGQAQTGTGKTLSFLLAVFQKLLETETGDKQLKQPRALILAPTRELAIQIYKDAELLNKDIGLRIEAVYGGTDYEKQRQNLRDGVDILIATPGRVIDYFKQKVFNLRYIQAMVMDEADRMFDLGFIKDIRFLMRRLPEKSQRLSLMFSATLSYKVQELAYEQMDHPQVIKIESDEVTTDNVEQSIYYVANEEKIPLLLGLFKKLEPTLSIVFVNTKAEAEKVCSYLVGNEIDAKILSGDVPQKQRQRLVSQLKEGTVPVLVATDVAARGLHIDNVSHVFNYDLPQEAEDYVHRIGRTGRIGQKGVAISLACENYAFHLPEIEEYIDKKIDKAAVSADLLVTPKPRAHLKMQRPRHSQDKKRSGAPRKKSSHRPRRKPAS